MRSWVLLLLLLTARARLGSAEGDPLPQSLVDLVMDSPISSVEDLKLLLRQETEAIEDEEDEHDSFPNTNRGRYVRSLVDVQQAQQAVCKVRTEIMEVTRSMLDRRNANFLLWPTCVEVQRCSGCCNNRQQQCVATVTSSRYLQVIKIQYINRRAHFEKAIISVEDHVSCRCQLSHPNPSPAHPQRLPPSSHVPVSPPRTAHPVSPKTHTSKADLHRHDDLKHNQQHHREHDPAARQWQQGSYTQLVRWTQPKVHQPAGVTQTKPGPLGSVGVRPSDARTGHGGHGSGGGEVHHPDHERRQQQLLEQQQKQELHQYDPPELFSPGGDDEGLYGPQADSASPVISVLQPPKLGINPTSPPSSTQKDSVTGQRFTAVSSSKHTETQRVGVKDGPEREESGSAVNGDSAAVEPVDQEKEKDSKVSVEEGGFTEEERKQKLLEMVQVEPDSPPSLHPQHRPKAAASKSERLKVESVRTAARRAPFRPASPRRRRKHRKRISKAAMRAMIM